MLTLKVRSSFSEKVGENEQVHISCKWIYVDKKEIWCHQTIKFRSLDGENENIHSWFLPVWYLDNILLQYEHMNMNCIHWIINNVGGLQKTSPEWWIRRGWRYEFFMAKNLLEHHEMLSWSYNGPGDRRSEQIRQHSTALRNSSWPLRPLSS